MNDSKNTHSLNVQAYFARQLEWLKQEEAYELNAYRQLLAERCIYGHMSHSDGVYPVQIGSAAYNVMDALTLPVTFDATDEDAGSDLEPGSALTFFRLGADNRTMVPFPTTCYVDKILGTGRLLVQVPGHAALRTLQEWNRTHLLGIQKGIDNASYRIMQESVQQAARSTHAPFLRMMQVALGAAAPTTRKLPAVRFPWLNESQAHAVNRVLSCREVSIVHGPPGTGKTTTLTEAILETLRRETQVLVCAPSNAAVDHISSLLMRDGISVLRIGNPLRIRDEMLNCSFERRFADHPQYGELHALRRELHTLRTLPSEKRNSEINSKIAKLREKCDELTYTMQNDILDNVRVVSCTLVGSANHLLEHRHFSTLFIDEAAQALEPSCWTAMLKADRVVFCGDYRQLPPTIKCPDIQHHPDGWHVTLMQRIARQWPQSVTLLNIQYRMHEDIMAFSSRYFYHNQLVADSTVAHRLLALYDTPLMFVDTAECRFQERRKGITGSISNAEEARLVVHTLREYVELLGISRMLQDQVDVGIITPYRSQVRTLRRLLKMQYFYRTLRRQISVNTVDAFQGQERDVILISMVRDNEEGSIGFLHDHRRMNVAITRARMKLIVIGNSTVLSRHSFYEKLLEHFRERGTVVQAQMPATPPSPA